LPDIPKDWIEFINGVHPELSAVSFPSLQQSLRTWADTKRFPRKKNTSRLRQALVCPDTHGESLQRLEQRGSIAVIASVDPDLFGGSLSQFMKCLTAARISEELAKKSIDAVAVCWIRSHSGPGPSPDQTLNILDQERKLHQFCNRTVKSSNERSEYIHLYDEPSDLIAEIEEFGLGKFDPEVLDLLRAAYSSGASGLAQIFADLMQMWRGIVVDSRTPGFRAELEKEWDPIFRSAGGYQSIEPGETSAPFSCSVSADYVMECLAFPESLFVIDSQDMEFFAQARVSLEEHHGMAPCVWPAISATLIDKHSRRTLEKYGLGIQDLFEGDAKLLKRLKEKIPVHSAGQRLDLLESELQQHMDTLDGLVLQDVSFHKTREACSGHIVFQLNKVKNRFETAGLQKLEVMQRRIPSMCRFLAPEGKPQEYGLSGIYFLLLYGRKLFPFLYKNLDFEAFEHQIIEMY